MMDDLQQAYSAYQSALINLQNPKVSATQDLTTDKFVLADARCRNLVFGTASAYSMTAMDLLSMRRKLSPRSCKCSLTSTRPTRSISV